uniref:rRNA biogenesis protein RRP36 n=1 Tax=Glossina palpalis gambiensis TaxID=67801 RepID=A0A240SXH1_9MUSC
MSSSEDSNNEIDEEIDERKLIRQDLSSMSFEEIMKLKEELGAKLYKEAILGIEKPKTSRNQKNAKDLKRLNKNRPREQSSKRPVPFLGAELRGKSKNDLQLRDPRFDERAGNYDVNKFKENYKFVSSIRESEILELKSELNRVTDQEEKDRIKKAMQRLANKNVEENKWHKKQQTLKEEQQEIQKAIAEGKKPHYLTKKERKAKELVAQFEELKKHGKLTKHLEKRRKKNIAKDRKKMNFA